MKTKTCRLCFASFVPKDKEEYCQTCYFPKIQSQDISRVKHVMTNEGSDIINNINPDTQKLNKPKEVKHNDKLQ